MSQQAQGQTTTTTCNTSPINIDMNTSVPSCNILCSYKYDYNDSKCVVSINSLGYLEIKYDLKRDGTEAQSSLNRDNYNIADIRIYQPSIHTYDGKKTDVELIIHHGVGSVGSGISPYSHNSRILFCIMFIHRKYKIIFFVLRSSFI